MSQLTRLKKELEILKKQLSAGIITKYEFLRIEKRVKAKLKLIKPKSPTKKKVTKKTSKRKTLKKKTKRKKR